MLGPYRPVGEADLAADRLFAAILPRVTHHARDAIGVGEPEIGALSGEARDLPAAPDSLEDLFDNRLVIHLLLSSHASGRVIDGRSGPGAGGSLGAKSPDLEPIQIQDSKAG